MLHEKLRHYNYIDEKKKRKNRRNNNDNNATATKRSYIQMAVEKCVRGRISEGMNRSVQRNSKRITHNRWISDVWLLSAVRCFERACSTSTTKDKMKNDRQRGYGKGYQHVQNHSPTSYRTFLRLFCDDLLLKCYFESKN